MGWHAEPYAQYLTNTLGIQVHVLAHANTIDSPLTATETKQAWRKATFLCRCTENSTISTFHHRSFCNSCSYLVPISHITHGTKCAGCNVNESWERIRFPCLALSIC